MNIFSKKLMKFGAVLLISTTVLISLICSSQILLYSGGNCDTGMVNHSNPVLCGVQNVVHGSILSISILSSIALIVLLLTIASSVFLYSKQYLYIEPIIGPPRSSFYEKIAKSHLFFITLFSRGILNPKTF